MRPGGHAGGEPHFVETISSVILGIFAIARGRTNGNENRNYQNDRVGNSAALN